jgi:hypothetical protein
MCSPTLQTLSRPNRTSAATQDTKATGHRACCALSAALSPSSVNVPSSFVCEATDGPVDDEGTGGGGDDGRAAGCEEETLWKKRRMSDFPATDLNSKATWFWDS